MICKTSCAVFIVFLIGTLLMQLMTYRLPIYADLMALLDAEAQETYKNIKKMRVMTSLQGYGLGLFLSLVVLIYNYNQPKAQRYSTRMMVCVAGATTFLTHYFYYVLSPKSDWMLNHLKTPEQTKEWLKIYKTMSWNYHISLLVGVLSAVALGSVFKCD
jgi:hypothetical protein